MGDTPPPPMDYESKRDQKQRRNESRKGPGRSVEVFLGLLGGGILSGIVWGWLFGYARGQVWLSAIVFVPAIKVIIGVVMLAEVRMRYYGIGVLLSIALGGLIFFGICAANFKV